MFLLNNCLVKFLWPRRLSKQTEEQIWRAPRGRIRRTAGKTRSDVICVRCALYNPIIVGVDLINGAVLIDSFDQLGTPKSQFSS